MLISINAIKPNISNNYIGITVSRNGARKKITCKYHQLNKSSQYNSLSLNKTLINTKHCIINKTYQELCNKIHFQ